MSEMGEEELEQKKVIEQKDAPDKRTKPCLCKLRVCPSTLYDNKQNSEECTQFTHGTHILETLLLLLCWVLLEFGVGKVILERRIEGSNGEHVVSKLKK